MADEPDAREEPAGRPAKLGFVRRIREWWWGRPAEGPNWEEPTWRIAAYPPGPGAKIAKLSHYFRERGPAFLAGLLLGGLLVAAVTWREMSGLAGVLVGATISAVAASLVALEARRVQLAATT